MFRKILFLFALFSRCFGQDLPSIGGYINAQEGVCIDNAGSEPNYLELWFQEHPHNCTTVCDDLPTCSGISYTPSRFKLQCRIYVFYHIQQVVETFPNEYLDQEHFWIPTGDDGSQHAVTVGGNGGRYCYIRITEAPSASPSNSPSTHPSGGPSTRPTVSPSYQPTVRPSFFPSTLPSVGPSNDPSTSPSVSPSHIPTKGPTSDSPSTSPSIAPTSDSPSNFPSVDPSAGPSYSPSTSPTTDQPTVSPTENPTFEEPTKAPTFEEPTISPSKSPSTDQPTVGPTRNPTFEEPTVLPTRNPTVSQPTSSPSKTPTTDQPTVAPTRNPTSDQPTNTPSDSPITQKPSTSPTTESPSVQPTCSPSTKPSVEPTNRPSVSPETSRPSVTPTTSPSMQPQTPFPSTTPTIPPSNGPSVDPTKFPTGPPSLFPTDNPSTTPSKNPTGPPSAFPSGAPSFGPSVDPTAGPTVSPSAPPSDNPTVTPSAPPTKGPTTDQPTVSPSRNPTSDSPSTIPTVDPSLSPSFDPSTSPSVDPTTKPTLFPSVKPTTIPSNCPSVDPTVSPSHSPSVDPTQFPSTDPSSDPSTPPTKAPTTDSPSVQPTVAPSDSPTTDSPSVNPTVDPTKQPTNEEPTVSPTKFPTTDTPSVQPTSRPSRSPTTDQPTMTPSTSPTKSPTTDQPTTMPSNAPSGSPTVTPSDGPSVDPTTSPSYSPSVIPTDAPSYTPTIVPSNLPSITPSITSPCSIGKLNVLGSHFIYLDEEDSFVDDDDLVFLALGIPNRYRINKVWPSDAETENGYYYQAGTNEFWTLSEDTKQECTSRITGGFPWPRIRTRELMGLTTVTDPSYYEEVHGGSYFHNILTLELSENYTSPDGWAKPGEEEYIERKVIYEIPWLILLQTEITLTVDFTVVIPTPGPSTSPTVFPSTGPTVDPTVSPSVDPTRAPTSEDPTVSPTNNPTVSPSVNPSNNPSTSPSVDPTHVPSVDPSVNPSYSPSVDPTTNPSYSPSVIPTTNPSGSPTPRLYFYYNLTLRADDTWSIRDYVTEYPTFSPSQRFEVLEDVPHGGFAFLGSAAHQTDITPDELGLFKWAGGNVTSDTFMTWMAESDNIRVRFDILLLSPRDCIASFTEWGVCSVTCGDGIETQMWIVTDGADAAGYCEHWDGFVDTRPCYIEVCPLIDEIVTRFAVYNPDLDENSTVCMNFTTVANLPWKTVEDGFWIVDPNNILNENSADFSFDPVEGCWPSWSYDEFDGLCGQLLPSNHVKHPTGMFIQITDLDDSICKNVCDYFAEDCIAYDVLPSLGSQPSVCEVLGPALTPAHTAEANQFIQDWRTFDWYFDEATEITGGYTFAQFGAKCYRKGDPVYTGNCLQDFNMCFTMDFVCNLDETFFLELTAENLITGTQITRQFETRIATDASCAQIIGDVKLSGKLEAFYNETRTQSVIQFYKGDTIYFTVEIDSYANVDSISLVEMRYTQDVAEGTPTSAYHISHTSAITMDASQVEPATQTFVTEGRFSMLVTDPIAGSVDGVYTKWVATFGVNFIDGRRRLVEGSYTRNIRTEMNTLIYPPKCRDPNADPGETLTQTCDEGKRIIWCDENGNWVLLVDSCGDDVPSNFGGLSSTQTPSITQVIHQEEDETFLWRTSAIAIGVSLCCACCVYYLLVCRKKKEKETVIFFDDPNKYIAGSRVDYIEEVPEDSESSELGSEYQTHIGTDFVTKRTPEGPLMAPPMYEHAEIEHDSESSELGTDFNTNIGKDINSDIDQDMKAANQVFNDLGLQDITHDRPATPV